MKQLQKYILLIFALLFIVPSCGKKFLEEVVVSNVVDSYFNTRAGFEDALKGAYSSMRAFYGSERGMSMTVFGTDTYTRGADGSFKFFNDYTAQLDARNQLTNEIWNEFYRAINTANAVISRADQLTTIDQATRDRRVAEAKFIRAHHYFILVQLFGEVHLALEENRTITTKASRSSIKNIYEAIVKDLEAAIPKLEPDVKKVDWGRATKPAAEHLLARVYLTKATSEAKAADDYAKALQYAKSIINSNAFKLLPDFAKVFEQGAGEINDEVIWSVQYTTDPLTNFQAGNGSNSGNNSHVFFIMEYDVLPGMQRDVANGRPFKRFRPTDFGLSLWDRTNDARYEKTFKMTFFSNRPGAFTVDGRPVTFNAGDTAIHLPSRELSQAEILKRPYLVITPSRYSERWFPTLTKFLDATRPDRTTFEGSRDFLAFRLAETYLIAAEAAMYTGNTAEAATFLNVVRRRAAFAGKERAMEITATQVNIDFILDEKEREMMGEQLRWFDLVRTGKLLERVKKHNPQAAPGIKDFHVRRPIPQTQIDLTEGGPANFPQNTGY
jgi:hypothetical protein